MKLPIPVLGIPHYNRPDLLVRCIKSIDYPVDTLVIVRNGPLHQFPLDYIKQLKTELATHDVSDDSYMDDPNYLVAPGAQPKKIKKFNRIEVIQHPNAGVAGAWNEVIKLFPAKYWMLANNDIQFTPGDLETMADEAQASVDRPVLHMIGKIYGNHGASWFVITELGVSIAGLFDENIFPAYLEDCDMSYRMDLLGLRRPTIPVFGRKQVNAVHGDEKLSGSCTVNSDPALRQQNSETHQRNFAYYERKWGGRNEQETFKTPFNKPLLPVDYWKFEPALRAQQQWKL